MALSKNSQRRVFRYHWAPHLLVYAPVGSTQEIPENTPLCVYELQNSRSRPPSITVYKPRPPDASPNAHNPTPAPPPPPMRHRRQPPPCAPIHCTRAPIPKLCHAPDGMQCWPTMAYPDVRRSRWVSQSVDGFAMNRLGVVPGLAPSTWFVRQGGRLKRSARAVQLFGRLAVLETHTLRY